MRFYLKRMIQGFLTIILPPIIAITMLVMAPKIVLVILGACVLALLSYVAGVEIFGDKPK